MKIRNTEDLAVGDMKDDLLERKPLPIGRKEFMAWSDRIISKAGVDGTEDSLRFALGAMLMQLSPTEAFREDAYFILSLRKSAVNQTAHAIMSELKEKQLESEKAKDMAPKLVGATNGSVLENQRV